MQTYLKGLVKRKDLVAYLVSSGLKAEHRNSLLGYLWWLLDPLLNTAIYYFVVVVVFRRGDDRYGLFLVIGMIAWRWFHATLNAASRSITSQAGIITQVSVPKAIFPIGVTLTQLFHFNFGLLVIGMFLLVFRVYASLEWLWMPYIVVVQFAFSTGLALVLAYISVFVRDMENLLGHILQLWFFGSPILWPESMIPSAYKWLLEINPISHLVGSYREVLLDHRAPDVGALAIIGICSVLLVIFMLYFYDRHEHKVIKVL